MEKRISVKLETNWIEMLDDIATYSRVSRHNMMQSIVRAALQEILNIEQVNLFKVGLVLDEMMREVPVYTMAYQVKPIPLALEDGELDQIDEIAEAFNYSRHMLLCKLIMGGIYELNKPEHLGLFPEEDFRSYLLKQFQTIAQNGQKAFCAVFD